MTLNKSPAFILNVLGWDASNIASQLKKVDDHTLTLHWTADVSPSVALNILSTPIASIVDEKQVAANVKDNDFGNAWLKMHSAGSGAVQNARLPAASGHRAGSQRIRARRRAEA